MEKGHRQLTSHLNHNRQSSFDSIKNHGSRLFDQDKFLTGIQHEIRTPFVGLIGLIQYLHHSETDPERKNMLEMALNSNNRLLNFLNQLIQYAEVSQDKIHPIVKEVKLRELFDDLKTLLQPTLDQKNIQFHYAISDRIPPLLYGNVYHIQQMLFYGVNAFIDYMNQGEIEIKVRKLQIITQTIIITLDFNITGLDQSLQEKYFFEPFADSRILLEGQAKQNKTHIFNFAILKAYIKQLQGHIDIQKQTDHSTSLKKQETHSSSQQTNPERWICRCIFPLQLESPGQKQREHHEYKNRTNR